MSPLAQLDPRGPGRVIKVEVQRAHGHVKVRIWIGQDGSPGLVGELTMRREDWHDLFHVLMYGTTYYDACAGPDSDIAYDMSPDDLDWLRAGDQ